MIEHPVLIRSCRKAANILTGIRCSSINILPHPLTGRNPQNEL